MKYLREVLPYFRKKSILADILWDDDPYATPRSMLKDRSRSDIKVSESSKRFPQNCVQIIPLKLAYVIRGSLYQCDPERRFIELISPNGRHTGERQKRDNNLIRICSHSPLPDTARRRCVVSVNSLVRRFASNTGERGAQFDAWRESGGKKQA